MAYVTKFLPEATSESWKSLEPPGFFDEQSLRLLIETLCRQADNYRSIAAAHSQRKP
jgi:hypothetical protein